VIDALLAKDDLTDKEHLVGVGIAHGGGRSFGKVLTGAIGLPEMGG
jgi:hypothetical protein